MARFTRRPIAAAVILMFSGAGAALAQQPAAPEAPQPPTQTMPEVKVTAPPDGGQGFKVELEPRAATHRDAAARHSAVHEHRAARPVIRQQAMRPRSAMRCATCPASRTPRPRAASPRRQIFWLRGFPGGRRPVPRRRARHRRVQPRPLQHRAGGGAEGTVGAHVRPRLDRRRHQPGHQGRPSFCSAAEVGLSVGTNGEARLDRRRELPSSAPSNAFRFKVLGEYSETYRDTIQNDQIGFAPTLRFGIGTATDVMLAYEYLLDQDQDGLRPAELSAPTFGYAHAAGIAEAVLRASRTTTYTDSDDQHRDGHGRLTGSATRSASAT